MDHDVFISHATEDKDEFVRGLVDALKQLGVTVWIDEAAIEPAKGMLAAMDNGILTSRCGVIVLSNHYFGKHWTKQELGGILQRESQGEMKIVLVWHGVGATEVANFSPILASRLGLQSVSGPHVIAEQIRAVLEGAPASAAQLPPAYTHEVPVHYQGQLNISQRHVLEITEWFGPDGPGGSGELRIARMVDLTDQRSYTSDIANVMMTIVPTKVAIRGRVKGPIEGTGKTTRFRLELTDEEYEIFDANSVVQQNLLVG